jgi:hypothetical protein
VIRACHPLGFVCDVAHAIKDMVKQTVKVATKPLLLSHTALSRAGDWPNPVEGRQISPDDARAIAETGGSVGIWHVFPNLGKYVGGLREWPKSSGSIMSASAPTSMSRRGACRITPNGVQLSAAILREGFSPRSRTDHRRQGYERLSRRVRLTLQTSWRRTTAIDQTQARPDRAAVDAALAVLDRLMAALNSGDEPALPATLHFPHYRLAEGQHAGVESACCQF